MIGAVVSKYEERINALREKMLEIASENQKLIKELDQLKSKEDLVLTTLERAEKTAKNVKEDINAQYELEVERLKNFAKKWNGYFKDLKEKYPAYPTTKKAVEIGEKVNKLGKKVNAKKVIDEILTQIEQ